MCVRYYIEQSPELIKILKEAKRNRLTTKMIIHIGTAFHTEGEICPKNMVPVIAPDHNGNIGYFPMIWGFSIPGIKDPVINVSIESIMKKRTFQESWERRRCIVPASYYFEWKRIQSGGRVVLGDKYAIQPSGENMTWLAGVYRIEEGYQGFKYPAFTILTKKSVSVLTHIHNRMPVILPLDKIEAWINPNTKERNIKEIVKESLTDLIAEKC